MQTNTLSPNATSSESPQAVNTVPPQMVLMQMVTAYWVSQSIYAAAKLGIADQLKLGPQHCDQLAVTTGCDRTALYRLLRALASVGIFAETEPGYFCLTPLGDYLRSDMPGSVRDASIMVGDPEHYNAWGNILHSVKTGESAFENLFGMNIFQYYAQNPEPAAVFDRAMTSFSSTEIAGVVAAYDFSPIRKLVDVAGGHGSFLFSILKANPHLEGILFDQAEVIDRAQSLIGSEPLLNRCQLAAGDFFEAVPAGADAYILKHIIHDWDDERAIAILKQCHRAMTADGRVLVVEQVIPPGNEPFLGKLLDVNMLVMCPGGKERTAAEYQQIFAAAGFKLTRIVPTETFVSVVEGVRL
ncbi:methyltransferase [Kovacikia minuta CCNUW1]|uniref:acetylserotonin O-methyltransferase n=1 Tax=Kovacikia minuta TaxID=2931930 RepID=UPI001CCC6EEE|nr:acetylserotonin O-methyltransferase [Kovacikia minuta]UBF25808.1 methyltransferase [Kovacikia minuta CCNUW1]